MLEKKINLLSKRIKDFQVDGWSWTLSMNLEKVKIISPSKKEYTLDNFQESKGNYNEEEINAKRYLEAIQEKEYLIKLQRKNTLFEKILKLDNKNNYLWLWYSHN